MVWGKEGLEDTVGSVAVIRESRLEWVVVRGPRLTEERRKENTA